jgi:hypothetical protein
MAAEAGMDPLTALLAPGLIGGCIVAVWLWVEHRRGRQAGLVVPHEDSILIDAINISHIRVAGAGGLGLVAMAAIVAVFVPAIGLSLVIALAAGIVLAVMLILARRVTGPLPSAGKDASSHL